MTLKFLATRLGEGGGVFWALLCHHPFFNLFNEIKLNNSTNQV